MPGEIASSPPATRAATVPITGRIARTIATVAMPNTTGTRRIAVSVSPNRISDNSAA